MEISNNTGVVFRQIKEGLLHTDQDARGSICEGAVGDVRVACDPADVSRAPVHVVGVVVENILEGQRRVEQVAGNGVENSLRRTRGRKRERGDNWSTQRQQT